MVWDTVPSPSLTLLVGVFYHSSKGTTRISYDFFFQWERKMCIRNLYFSLKNKIRQKWLTPQASYCLRWKCSVVLTQGDKKDKSQHPREDRAGTRKPGSLIASPRRRMNALSQQSPDFFSRTGIIALYSFRLMLLGFGCLKSKTILTDPLSSKWGNKKKNLKSLLNYSAPHMPADENF